MQKSKTHTILADGQELFRKGLAALLKTSPGIEIISEVENGRQLLEQLKETGAHLVVLSTHLTSVSSRAVLDVIRQRFSNTRTILLGDQPNAQLQAEFMALGANGYLHKTCSFEVLLSAIDKVQSENYFFDATTSKALLDELLKKQQRRLNPASAGLNSRETEIIRKICEGLTNKEIASSLNLSISTIDFYRTRIYDKTQCNNAIRLLRYAVKNGLIELAE